VDHEAGGLVDDEQVLVLVCDAERRRVLDSGLDNHLGLRHLERDLLALLNAVALRSALAVDRDRSACGEQPLRVGARAELLERCEEAVEPLARGVSGDAYAGDR
jgi:hypothetical protein